MVQFAVTEGFAPVLVWTEQNYERARQISEDYMPQTYTGWQIIFAIAKARIPKNLEIVCVYADPDDVARWCRSNNRKVTIGNRAAYALAHYQRQKLQ
ncbi:hypothetical protein [Limoniibacter endophyticus]|uniref:Uncharacterized protein n=1 Tax=Limoniibacter endophyticus TaxID=1565040 RepID=A0A8J3DUW7_9HYPH|nr:hypothetical protein [Limoniibacter endophyticus]GHC79565.1 hypothetical protein GCM10010136_32230 [Limoniibacter endophyticus]